MQLENLSKTDPLTGLLNVRHLNETLTRALRAAQRRDEAVTVAYIDLNDFKAYFINIWKYFSNYIGFFDVDRKDIKLINNLNNIQ